MVKKIAENSRGTQHALLVIILITIADFLCNYSQYQLSPISQRIMEMYSLNAVEYASVYTAAQIPTIFLGLFVGSLCDRFGAKKVLGAGMIAMTAGLFTRFFADSYIVLYVGMIFAGISTGCNHICMAKVANIYYKDNKAAQMVGIIMGGSSIGMFLGMCTTAFFTSIKTVFLLPAIGSLIITVLWIILIKPIWPENEVKAPGVIESFVAAVKSKEIIFCGVAAGMMIVPLTTISAFMPQALQSRNYSESTSGIMVALLLVGCIFGSFFGVKLLKFVSFKVLAILSCAVTAVLVPFVWAMPFVLLIIMILILGFAISLAFTLVLMASARDKKIGVRYAGAGSGIVSILQMLLGVLISTYIVTPIAGNNYWIMYGMASICAIIGIVMLCLLPKDY